ncbi:hypothetical protein COOONC_00803 [Cooperia oncophora]
MNMVRHLVPVALLLIAVYLPQSTSGAEISVRIERHFPCSASSGPKKENLLIKFPSYKTAGVQFHEETNSQGHKCFRMSGGKVEVYPPGLNGSKKYYVHLETRIGIHGKPERCVNADSSGCGGIGSCVHCDICQTMGGSLKNFVQIFQGNKPAQCSSQVQSRLRRIHNYHNTISDRGKPRKLKTKILIEKYSSVKAQHAEGSFAARMDASALISREERTPSQTALSAQIGKLELVANLSDFLHLVDLSVALRAESTSSLPWIVTHLS